MNSFKFDLPYKLHVKANNSLGTILSEDHLAETSEIGEYI